MDDGCGVDGRYRAGRVSAQGPVATAMEIEIGKNRQSESCLFGRHSSPQVWSLSTWRKLSFRVDFWRVAGRSSFYVHAIENLPGAEIERRCGI